MRRFFAILCSILLLSAASLAQEGREEPWANPAWVTLGDIQLGRTSPEVLQVLKKPTRFKPRYVEGATGYRIQTWVYSRLGLELEMATEETEAPQTWLYRIKAVAPSQRQAFNGVKIGSRLADVRAAAEAAKTQGEVEIWDSDDGSNLGILWTHTYQVLSFGLRDGRVTEIFLGPGPE